MRNADSIENLEALAKPLVEIIRTKILQSYQSVTLINDPRGQELASALARLEKNPELFYVFITKDLLDLENENPYFRFGVKASNDDERSLPIELSEDASKDIKAMPNGDFFTLCEYAAIHPVKIWQDKLQNSSEDHLNNPHNKYYTNRQFYQIMIERVQKTHAYVLDNEGSIKSAIDVPGGDYLIQR